MTRLLGRPHNLTEQVICVPRCCDPAANNTRICREGCLVFDRWYAEMGRSASRDQIVRWALGLPSDIDATGLLPWAGVVEVAAALNLAPGVCCWSISAAGAAVTAWR